MNKNNLKTIKNNLYSFFYKSLFICFLVINTPFSLEASQSTKLGWKASFCTGICIYLASKLSPSQSKELEDVTLSYKEKKQKVLELVAARPVETVKEEVDHHGSALVQLYIVNTNLSKKIFNRLEADFSPCQQVFFTVDLSDFIGDQKGKSLCKVGHFNKSKPFSSMRSLTLLASLFLLSSIPGVEAKVVDDLAFVDQGAIACAACIAGCCAALGQIEGPVCVLHCSTGPCAWLCAAPIP